METYLIMVDNMGCCYLSEVATDKTEALKTCKQLNQGAGPGSRFFVVNGSSGQTWEYLNGNMYRVILRPEVGEIAYKEVAI